MLRMSWEFTKEKRKKNALDQESDQENDKEKKVFRLKNVNQIYPLTQFLPFVEYILKNEANF